MVEYPVICILGERGAGKTLSAVTLMNAYIQEEKRKIFTNIDTDLKHEPLDFDELGSLPEHLDNAVLFIDEMHVGADAYDFFTSRSRHLKTFITQLRKRHITMYWITQRWKFNNINLRRMTNYIFQCNPMMNVQGDFNGKVRIQIFDRSESMNEYIKTIVIDGKPFYDHYDTDQIIYNE